MEPILIDTHVLVWSEIGGGSIGPQARQRIESSLVQECAFISAATFWELAMLKRKGRLITPEPVIEWRESLLQFGFRELPITGEIAITSQLLENFQADPGDRFLVATAMEEGCYILTCDSEILDKESKHIAIDARI